MNDKYDAEFIEMAKMMPVDRLVKALISACMQRDKYKQFLEDAEELVRRLDEGEKI